MSVYQLKSQCRSKRASLTTFNNRQQAVQRIITNIDHYLDDDVADVNLEINRCISDMSQGLKGVGRASVICDDLSTLRESNVGYDYNISSCRSNLNREVTRCQSQASSISSEISSLESRIWTESHKK